VCVLRGVFGTEGKISLNPTQGGKETYARFVGPVENGRLCFWNWGCGKCLFLDDWCALHNTRNCSHVAGNQV
jgi:hypothetical protein